MRSDVRDWLFQQPAQLNENFGWALVNVDETSNQTVRAFYSSEATLDASGMPLNPAWRPTLVVTYYVPEPATAVLLSLAAPLAFPRARKCNGRTCG
jgi:hypothetical protein